jgi:beta-phosphoglucomutase
MEIKACIFDLDGVIVDTARYHFIAWQKIAHELGFAFTEEDNERLKGVSRMRSLEILLEVGGVTLDEATKEKLASQKNEIYLKYILQMTPHEILPGAKEFLHELNVNGIKIALGSASKNAMTILSNLEMVNLFDAIIDGTKVTKAKPNPEIFLKGAEELGVSADQCVVFEDAEAGIEAALAANMKCIGVGSPLTLRKAHLVIPGFEKFSLEKMISSPIN